MKKAFFSYACEIPPQTFPEAESREEMSLTYGEIDEIQIVFPAGCAGLAGIRFFHDTRQILPFNEDAYIFSDAEVIRIPLGFEIHAEPYTVEVRGVNMDDIYSHTVFVRIVMNLPSGERKWSADVDKIEYVKTLVNTMGIPSDEEEEEEEEGEDEGGEA